jgi:hypothetical protein
VLENRFKPVLLKRQGVALGVWGEAGIGKSYRLEQLLRTLPCRSLSLHAATPLATLAQTSPRPRKLATWAERTLERLGRGEAVETNSVLDTFATTLAGLAPFVLHLEDIHEVDSERLTFLQKLAYMAQRSRGVGLIITSRREPPEPFTTFRLEPLTREQSDGLLEREVSAVLPKEALEFIFSKAAGNPLYTLEYFRYLRRQGFLWNDGNHWHWRKPEQNIMPVTVEALIELALSRVSHEKGLETVLQTKAYLPLEISDALWQRVADTSAIELAAAKLDLERCNIFSKGDFAHPLYREVVLKRLSKLERQKLARRMLEALQGQPVQAAHFVMDANLTSEETQGLLEHAARQAKETDNTVQAGHFLAQASAYATGEAKRTLALEAATLLRGRDDQEALRLAHVATELEPSDEALYCLAEIFASQHRLREAETTLQRLSERSKLQGSWPLRLARVYANSFELNKLLELTETQPDIIGNDPYVDYIVSYAYHYMGNGSRAEQLATEALERPGLQAHERARFLGIFEASAVERGDYEKALSFSDERIASYRESQQTVSLASALEKRAELLEHVGHYEQQLAYLNEAYALFSEAGVYRRVTSTQGDLAYALIQRGEYERAEELLLEARSTLTRLEVSDSHLLIEAFLTLLYYEWRPPLASSLAARHAERLTRLEGPWLWPIMMAGTHWTASLVASWLGDPKRALQLAETGIKTSSELRHHNIHAANLHAKGLALEGLGQHQGALQSLEQAVINFQKAGFQGRAQRAALELDRLNNNLESARERVRWFQERGLLNGVTIAKRYFPELAEHPTNANPPLQDVPRLAVLGVMELQYSGQTSGVRGSKRQELFALLLEARLSGRGEVSRLELFDTLYAGTEENKALRSLKQLVHSLRLELGETVIKTTASGYALGTMTSDVETFLQTGDISLWRGRYLENVELTNTENVSESLYLFLFDKANALLNAEAKEVARVARVLLEYDPYNLPYLRLSLQALQLSDNYRTLGRVYETAKAHFAEIGEELPQTWAAFLNLPMNTA